MGGLVFSLAILLALAAVVARAVVRRVRSARLPDVVVVASVRDIPGLLRRRRCPCGRLPDEVGEDSEGDAVILSRECVCGRRERVRFVLGH